MIAWVMMAQQMGLLGTGLAAPEIIAVIMPATTMLAMPMPIRTMPTPTILAGRTVGATLTPDLHAMAQRQIPRRLPVMAAFVIEAQGIILPEIIPEQITGRMPGQIMAAETKMRVLPGNDPQQRVRPTAAVVVATGAVAVGAVNAITNSGVTALVIGLRYCAPGTGSSSF
jgi:hypothetical protein